MPRTVLLALLVAAAAGAGTGTATAVCDPKYRPLCFSDCPPVNVPDPDPKDPTDLTGLFRMCPDSL